jgi:peptidoglycan/xylan/chitin deacetylase (PgdA/CDA1 family)
VLPERLFRAHLDILRACRIPVLPLEALLEERPRRGVILTFDDAFADFGATAWPLLRERDYPAAVMVPTAHVGGQDRWNEREGPRRRRLLDWPALRRLRSEGAAVEAHGATHRDLLTLPLEHAEWELRTSRERLLAELGEPCRFLAYPYNRASPALAAAAQRAGYRGALGGDRADGSPFHRRRSDVSSAGVWRFAAEVFGGLDGMRWLKRRVRRVVGRGRRQPAGST